MSRIDINKKQDGVLYPSPVFCSGALSVDEAFTLAQAVCGGNAGTMAFVLMPQPHSSCSHTAILAHRRILEDKAVATLDGITFSCACLCVCVCVCVCALLFSVCLCARVFFCDLRGFDVNEVSLNFSDNVHGNDRRKTSQQCYWVKHYATSFRPATDASEVLCVAI